MSEKWYVLVGLELLSAIESQTLRKTKIRWANTEVPAGGVEIGRRYNLSNAIAMRASSAVMMVCLFIVRFVLKC